MMDGVLRDIGFGVVFASAGLLWLLGICLAVDWLRVKRRRRR